MPEVYSLEAKIRRYLMQTHSLEGIVVSGRKVSAAGGLFEIEGVVTKAKLDKLAETIKRRLGE